MSAQADLGVPPAALGVPPVIHGVALALEQHGPTLVNALAEVEEAMEYVCGIDDAIAALRAARDVVADAAWHRLEQDGRKTLTLEDGTIVEARHTGVSKTYDGALLVGAIAARAADERKLDEATGEYEREGDAVARIFAEVYPTNRPRITALRVHGIDPDRYLENETGQWRPSLVIRRPSGTIKGA